MRYPNDYEYLKERGFLAWHIIAPLDVRSTRLAVRGQLYDLDVDETHTSESALDGHKFDAVIENSGGLVDLHRYVDAALLQVLTDRAR
jgi:dephospho-CoA kinase